MKKKCVRNFIYSIQASLCVERESEDAGEEQILEI